jgi:sugar lactone lactonase YvrE
VVSETKLRKISPAGVVKTLWESNAFPWSTVPLATFRSLSSVAADSDGNVYAADISTIWKMNPDGELTAFAGWNTGSDDGAGTEARFYATAGAVTDSSGNLYVSDSANHTIRKISPNGMVTTFVGRAGVHGFADGVGQGARFWNPAGLTLDRSGNLIVADSANNTIRRITLAGVVTTVAGKPNIAPYYLDGNVSVARFSNPASVAVDHAGNIYALDVFNQAIRKITPAGTVSTPAGFLYVGTEDGTGTAARFNFPSQMVMDADENLYVSDSLNHTIRKVTLSGEVTTFAGRAGTAGDTDGPLSSALFNYPTGIAIDASRNILVVANHTIRMITPAGMVTTVAGISGAYGGADGTGSDARLNGGAGLAADSIGNVYVTDNAAIRRASPTLPDTASIDRSSAPAGESRQLGTAAQSATSWEWSIIRRPSGSSATLSSTTTRSPIFTPDVADLYQFRLVARGSAGTSMTVVSLLATPPPSEPRRHTVKH